MKPGLIFHWKLWTEFHFEVENIEIVSERWRHTG